MKNLSPIEGFFLETKEGLIFDVKGLSHPKDRVIAFVRYVPKKSINNTQVKKRSNYHKIYDLSKRYNFLQENFPEYLFDDPKGRGLLQAVTQSSIKMIYDPRKKLASMLSCEKEKPMAGKYALKLVNEILETSSVKSEHIGITGSLLVKLQSKKSDIDLVVYGMEAGKKIYQSMDQIFQEKNGIRRYTKEEIKKLMKIRGQEEQISFDDFLKIEKDKKLQGKIANIDFYIRLVPYPEECPEDYENTTIEKIDFIEVISKISDDERAIFTPAISYLKDVELISSRKSLGILPDRLYSVRGRYCEIAKENELVKIKGELERITTNGQIKHQIILGTNKDEHLLII